MAWEMSGGIKNVFLIHDLNRYETRKFPPFPLLPGEAIFQLAFPNACK